MKLFWPPRALLLSGILIPCLLQAEVLVDSNFLKRDPQGKPDIAPAKNPPLRMPTGLQMDPPSLISSGREKIGDLEPPYAIVQVRPREESPTAPANVRIIWDLRALPAVTTGKFEVTYTAVIVEPAASGGRFSVTFDAGSGNPEGRLHPSLRPLSILFKGESVTSNAKGASSVEVGTGKKFTVTLLGDLDKNVWSAKVDGRAIVRNFPFSEEFILAYHDKKIRSLEFGTVGGEDHQPTGKFAITDVRMELLK